MLNGLLNYMAHAKDRRVQILSYAMLISVTITERYPANRHATQSIDDISNWDIRSDTTDGHHGVQGQRIALVVSSIESRETGIISFLPDPVAVVNKGMMHPENRVTGTSRNIRHNSTNTIVSICMRTK